MSLTFQKGNLFESKTQTLVNTVNCVGAMGKGIALEFKKRNNEMYLSYKKICKKGLLKPGDLILWTKSEQWILNFPTKNDWRNKSKLEYIEKGLIKFKDTYKNKGITSISFPKLGCANGGLLWEEVKPIMIKHLDNLDIKIIIYE